MQSKRLKRNYKQIKTDRAIIIIIIIITIIIIIIIAIIIINCLFQPGDFSAGSTVGSTVFYGPRFSNLFQKI